MSDNSTLFETALKSATFLCGNMDLADLRQAYKLTFQLVDNIMEIMYNKATLNSDLNKTTLSNHEKNKVMKTEELKHSWCPEFLETDQMKPCQNCQIVNDETVLARGGCPKCPQTSCAFCSESCYQAIHAKIEKSEEEQARKNDSNSNAADQNMDILSQLPDVLKANLSSFVNNSMFLPFGNNLFHNQNFMNSVTASNNNSNDYPVYHKARGRPRGSSMIATSLRKPRGRPPSHNTCNSRMDSMGYDEDKNGLDFSMVEVKRRGRPPINGHRPVVSRGRVGRPRNSSYIDLNSNEKNNNHIGLPAKRQCNSPDVHQSENHNQNGHHDIQPRSPNSNVSNGSSNNSEVNTSTVESVLKSLSTQANGNSLMPFIGNIFDPAFFSQNNGSSSALESLRMSTVKNE